MYWLCDFESFKDGGENYVIKEISILRIDGVQCYTYRVKSPRGSNFPTNNSTITYQYNRHRIGWDEGDWKFVDAMSDICRKVKDCVVYVKGLEKKTFLEEYLPTVGELHMVPSFKKLNNCMAQWCTYRHRKHCAQRKVFELKHYIDTYNIILAFLS